MKFLSTNTDKINLNNKNYAPTKSSSNIPALQRFGLMASIPTFQHPNIPGLVLSVPTFHDILDGEHKFTTRNSELRGNESSVKFFE